jgi:hypothetical protein
MSFLCHFGIGLILVCLSIIRCHYGLLQGSGLCDLVSLNTELEFRQKLNKIKTKAFASVWSNSYQRLNFENF